MEFEEIGEFLEKHIQQQISFDRGLEEIRQFLKRYNDDKIISTVDGSRLSSEFNQYLETTLREKPLPKKIKSISFGLFTMLENDKELTTFYLCGSEITPIDDEDDWAVDPAYFPTSYGVLSDFETVNTAYPGLSGDQEVLIFNGILNLLIINNLKNHSPQLLKHRDSLYVGAGYDSGDIYVLGQLRKEGLQ